MDFTFTSEQEALRQQAREFLAATPEPTWAQLAELGWTGVSIAEDDGGAGLTFVEWADRVERCMPRERVEIACEAVGDTERTFRLSARGVQLQEAIGAVASELRAAR